MNKFEITAAIAVTATVAFLFGCERKSASPPKGDHHNHAAHGTHGTPKDACAEEEGKACNEAHGDACHEAEGEGDGIKICKEHDVPLKECGICKPEELPKLKPGESSKLRLASKDSAGLVGVEVEAARTGTAMGAIECYAELTYNQNKLARIVAPVTGILEQVEVDLGQQIVAAQPLARLWSASISEAGAKAVLARQTVERERKLRTQKISAEKDLQEAEAAFQSASQQLLTLGFTKEQIEAMEGRTRDSVLLPLRAPFAGEVVERAAVQGAMVETGKALFTVADCSNLWAFASVPESALGEIRMGQEVELRVESLPRQLFKGKVTWISPEVDDRTRMGRVRVEVPNPERLLKANFFAKARILLPGKEEAILVPESAIQRVEGNTMVFVQKSPDLFEARAVRLGQRLDGRVEVEGVQPGEPVVTVHGFALKSQLLISHLGAGCADD